MSVTIALKDATPSQNKERFYRPELDALRFVAFFSVFLFHYSFWMKTRFPAQRTLAEMGAYGMCLFFYLSSYLITELLLREKAKTYTIHVKSFFIRRVLRIWPLYFAFIALTVVLGQIYLPFRIDLHRVIALLSLSGNWYMVDHGVDPSPASPLWSISLEEQFYLVWPFLAKFGGGQGLGAASALLIPFAWLVLAFHRGEGILDQRIWCNSFVQFQFFAWGALTSLLLRRYSPRWSARMRAVTLLLGACLWLTGSLFSTNWYSPSAPSSELITIYVLMGTGCACFLLGLLGTPYNLVPDWAIYLGQISYGLYVFHVLNLMLINNLLSHIALHARILNQAIVFDVAEFSLSLASTIVCAALSYQFYERKFLKLKERFAFVKSRTA